MSIKIVQLGSKRKADEGLRIGTVRRPPRGIPKSDFSKKNYYDVWYPVLAPSLELMKKGQSATTEKEWSQFKKNYEKEMKSADADKTLDLLSALSHQTNFSMGCYCEDEAHCHRSILKELLIKKGAKLDKETD